MKKVRDIMIKGFVNAVQRSTSVADACRMMGQRNVGIVVVVDGRRLMGLFSERDLLRRVVKDGRTPETTPVEEVMTREIVVGTPDDDIDSAVRKMDRANIRHLPIIEGGQLVSMLSIRDLLRVNLQQKEEELQLLREYALAIPLEAVPPASEESGPSPAPRTPTGRYAVMIPDEP